VLAATTVSPDFLSHLLFWPDDRYIHGITLAPIGTLTMSYEEPELEDYQDALSRLAADLYSEAEYRAFINSLFRAEAGNWVRATHLCRQVAALRRRIQALEQRAIDEGYSQEGRLSVRWQQYGEGMCLITFFLDVNLWNYMVVINPAQFRLDPQA
jgi:hypothetical protein